MVFSRPAILHSREASEPVRRALAWLAEECESTEGEAVRILCDAARELGCSPSETSKASRGIAGIVQESAACLQLLRELRPGGLPLEELQEIAGILKIMRDQETSVEELQAIVQAQRRIKQAGLDIELAEALLLEFRRLESKTGKKAPELLRRLADRVVSAETLDAYLEEARCDKAALQRETESLTEEYEQLLERVAPLRGRIQEQKRILFELMKKRGDLENAIRKVRSSCRMLRIWLRFPTFPPLSMRERMEYVRR